jgi:hypothetical protein
MINSDDFPKLKKEEFLQNKVDVTLRHWKDEAAKASNLAEYDATKPLFDDYMSVFHEWEKYFNDNYSILVAKKQ